MSENKKLGRGLSDLLQDQSLLQQVEILQKDRAASKIRLPIDKIVANPYQPRKNFDPVKLQELADSIKEHGVFTPILVRAVGDKYEIIAGERRYRASKLAGEKDIPAIIEQFDDEEMSEIALIENIQRENLSALEEARAYAEMQQKYGLTQQELARKVGKSRSYIANILRLRQLPSKVQNELENHHLSVGHVRTLVGLEEKDALTYLEMMKSGNMSVRQAEEFVQTLKNNSDTSKKVAAQKALSKKLKTKVTVSKKAIKIEYDSPEELEKLLEQLTQLTKK